MLPRTRSWADPAGSDYWLAHVRRGDDGFAGLGADWADLVSRCATATPFQSYAWLRAWWHAYGTPGTLRLALVRRNDRLVAAAPFVLRRRAGCPVLTPMGVPFADFTDVLVADDAPDAVDWLVRALLAEPGWQAVDLPEVRSGGPADRRLGPAWPGRQWRTAGSLCLDLPAVPMAELVRNLPPHSRKTVRRRLNQLARAGVQVRPVDAGDAGRAVADLLRLHDRQWQGRGGNPAHRSPRFGAFLTAAAADMIAGDEAALFEYRLDDRLVASSLVLLGDGLAGGYLYGADPQLRDRVDVTTMLLADTMPLAYRRGCTTMSLLRGAEEHKRRWRPVESPNRGLLLARPGSARGTAYASAVATGRDARRAAVRKAPWLRDVRDRMLRSTR